MMPGSLQFCHIVLHQTGEMAAATVDFVPVMVAIHRDPNLQTVRCDSCNVSWNSLCLQAQYLWLMDSSRRD